MAAHPLYPEDVGRVMRDHPRASQGQICALLGVPGGGLGQAPGRHGCRGGPLGRTDAPRPSLGVRAQELADSAPHGLADSDPGCMLNPAPSLLNWPALR